MLAPAAPVDPSATADPLVGKPPAADPQLSLPDLLSALQQIRRSSSPPPAARSDYSTIRSASPLVAVVRYSQIRPQPTSTASDPPDPKVAAADPQALDPPSPSQTPSASTPPRHSQFESSSHPHRRRSTLRLQICRRAARRRSRRQIRSKRPSSPPNPVAFLPLPPLHTPLQPSSSSSPPPLLRSPPSLLQSPAPPPPPPADQSAAAIVIFSSPLSSCATSRSLIPDALRSKYAAPPSSDDSRVSGKELQQFDLDFLIKSNLAKTRFDEAFKEILIL